MNERELQEALEAMREYIDREVKGGFSSEEEIATGVVEVVGDEFEPEELQPHAGRLTRERIEAHLREQATWPAQTDCDRLDAAFAELERAGIVARQNFSCCGNCGASEIQDEMEAARKAGVCVRGYTFYHMQDLEGAVDGRGTYLGYGAVEKGQPAALEIAREIVSTMLRNGLAAEWDGTWHNRIWVSLDWKRRREA